MGRRKVEGCVALGVVNKREGHPLKKKEVKAPEKRKEIVKFPQASVHVPLRFGDTFRYLEFYQASLVWAPHPHHWKER